RSTTTLTRTIAPNVAHIQAGADDSAAVTIRTVYARVIRATRARRLQTHAAGDGRLLVVPDDLAALDLGLEVGALAGAVAVVDVVLAGGLGGAGRQLRELGAEDRGGAAAALVESREAVLERLPCRRLGYCDFGGGGRGGLGLRLWG